MRRYLAVLTTAMGLLPLLVAVVRIVRAFAP